MTTPLLEARDLSATANGRALVDAVSLSVAAGDRLAIIGPNGAGKTTLLRMLSGMLRPSSGEVKLGGRRLDRISTAERALHIAVVGQTDQPDPRLAVIDYVELGRVPHAGLRRRSEERDIVVDALRRTGLLPLLGAASARCRAGNANAPSWRAPSHSNRKYCSSMSRPTISTRAPAVSFSNLWPASA